MELITKSLPDLTPSEFRRCSKLTFGDDGYMHETMRMFKDDPTAKAILLKVGTHIRAWALLIRSRALGEFWGVTQHGMKVTKYTIQVYVKENHRRKGYGTALVKEAQQFDKRLFVYPHNEAAGELYSKFKVSAEADYRRENMKRKKQLT